MSDLIDRQELLRQIDIDSDGEPGYYGDTWKFIDTIKSMPPAELGTNLAEVGTDCISREQAIDAARDWYEGLICGSFKGLEKRLRSLPPAQPDIIRCRNCKFASGDSRICMKFGHSPIGELDFCAWAERRTDE